MAQANVANSFRRSELEDVRADDSWTGTLPERSHAENRPAVDPHPILSRMHCETATSGVVHAYSIPVVALRSWVKPQSNSEAAWSQ